MTHGEPSAGVPRQVVTRGSLVRGLGALGIASGDVALVHTSLRSFGYVAGGAQSVQLALRDAIGPTGTLVVPAFTPQLCHPRTWLRRDLAPHPDVSAEIPPYDPLCTPVARTIGAVPDLVRSLPDALRSPHPHVSFAAQGPLAAAVVGRHPDAWRFSAQSPLGRLWDLDATVLMLGTGWGRCTVLHLAEYQVAYPGRRSGQWALPRAGADGATEWYDVPELLVWEGDFPSIGAAYEKAGGAMREVRIGDAVCRAVPVRPLVRFAARWLLVHRDLRRGVAPPGWRDVVEADGSLPVRLADGEDEAYPHEETPATRSTP
ncbi:AAC(3) family N-acetyltransferase [Streptomyces sp. NPDC006976]|uniref:aminoglycoside N(3)-acetyltransferase n=1 Tax=Streptomyces sp. NPDC006976 TaxID=3154311 RepID=UPI0033D84B8F